MADVAPGVNSGEANNNQGGKRKDPPTDSVSFCPDCGQDLPANDIQQRPHKKHQKVHENRAVFASNIPLDATFEEIEETFKKAGIIEQGVDGKSRIKMYADEKGNFNGNVLVVYFKKESIQQAIMRIDDWEFRLGDRSNGVVKVEEADMSFKKHVDGDVVKQQLVRKDRKAAERTRAELNR